MIEIKIPKEIKHYKEKLAFGLTVRQLISIGLAFTINIPLYFWGKEFISKEIMEWLVILVAMPLAMIGWFNYNGMNFEQFIIAILQSEFLYPQKRIYQSENLYENMLDFHIISERESRKANKKESLKPKKEKKLEKYQEEDYIEVTKKEENFSKVDILKENIVKEDKKVNKRENFKLKDLNNLKEKIKIKKENKNKEIEKENLESNLEEDKKESNIIEIKEERFNEVEDKKKKIAEYKKEIQELEIDQAIKEIASVDLTNENIETKTNKNQNNKQKEEKTLILNKNKETLKANIVVKKTQSKKQKSNNKEESKKTTVRINENKIKKPNRNNRNNLKLKRRRNIKNRVERRRN